jgi:AhpD family alkylhydroperoxidase
MQPRLDARKVAPGPSMPCWGWSRMFPSPSRLEPSLLELVRSRASQINGCAYCLDMHSKDARARGESEQRLYTLSAWRETPFFTDRERAALEWTEAITLISQGHAPDAVYEEVRKRFTEEELSSAEVAWK